MILILSPSLTRYSKSLDSFECNPAETPLPLMGKFSGAISVGWKGLYFFLDKKSIIENIDVVHGSRLVSLAIPTIGISDGHFRREGSPDSFPRVRAARSEIVSRVLDNVEEMGSLGARLFP